MRGARGTQAGSRALPPLARAPLLLAGLCHRLTTGSGRQAKLHACVIARARLRPTAEAWRRGPAHADMRYNLCTMYVALAHHAHRSTHSSSTFSTYGYLCHLRQVTCHSRCNYCLPVRCTHVRLGFLSSFLSERLVRTDSRNCASLLHTCFWHLSFTSHACRMFVQLHAWGE